MPVPTQKQWITASAYENRDFFRFDFTDLKGGDSSRGRSEPLSILRSDTIERFDILTCDMKTQLAAAL
jgi:hypothetical protein